MALYTMDLSPMALIAMLALFVAYIPSASAATIAYCSSENTGASSATLYWTWQSNGWCSDQCRGNAAFAIVLGNDCWCSDYIPADQTNTGDCNDDCPGFPEEKCGNKAKNLYGYIQLGEPSGTAGASQAASTSPSSASPSHFSTVRATQEPGPETVFQTVTAPAPVVTSTPPSSATPTTLRTATSGQSTGASLEAPYTSVRVVTVSGGIHTETIITQPNTTGAPSLSQNQKSSTPVGAIVGGVLGGLALLGIIIALVLFFLWKKRKHQREEEAAAAADGQSGVQRNVSTMSKAGLLHGEKQSSPYPPQIATTFHSSKRNSRMDLDNTSISPISASDRRSSRPVIFDQRLNPSAIMILDNGSRGSFASLDDSHDYGRALNVRNPDPTPRESFDVRSQNPNA